MKMNLPTMAGTSFGYLYIALLISIAVLVHGVEHDAIDTASMDMDTDADMEHVCLPGDQRCSSGDKLAEAEIGIDTVHVENSNAFDYDDDDDYYPDANAVITEVENDNDIVECKDEDERCEFWASHGECENNQNYMLHGCAKSCNSCPEKVSVNSYGDDQECQGDRKEELLEMVKKMETYMADVVSTKEYDKVRAECKNRNKLCAYWALIGECKVNAKYMRTHCAPACETCRMIDYDYRCPPDPNEKNALEAGDLNKMFTRITSEVENVTVLSKPNDEEALEKRMSSKKWDSPWVITIDDFITDEECDRLIELGGKQGYDRSTDVGKMKFDGTFEEKTSKTRTSHNAWCTEECYKDDLVQNVLERIAQLTGIPDQNSEYLQLLKYETGQFYRAHHDYIEADKNRQPGPRILTAFLYLNDVPAGGGTNFPDLDLTVMPKRGRILLWPSVLDINPSEKNFSTTHQALDVEDGLKFGANAWIHLRDFKTPYDIDCTG